MKDASGDPVSGVLVTFDAPTSGASGTFACSGNTAITNGAGMATSQVFTANDIAGKYTVTAVAKALTTQAGVCAHQQGGRARFHHGDRRDAATATVNTAFATQLAATVADTYGNPVAGATVTFNAPASGAERNLCRQCEYRDDQRAGHGDRAGVHSQHHRRAVTP